MCIRAYCRQLDGRWISAGMVIGFFLMLKLFSLALEKPVFDLPPFAWFGPMPPYFADLRGIVGWTEKRQAGISPQSPEFRDPWNRPDNYPRWWLYSNDLGLNRYTVMEFGYGMGALFLISSFYVLERLDVFGGLVAGLFLVSYAVMFGLERGNVDLLMFVLLALAVSLRRFPPLTAGVIALAAILKLHPAFAFFALLMPPWKKNLPWLGAGLFIFAVGTLHHLQDFTTAMRSAPNMRSGILSFGTTSLGLVYIERFNRPDLYLEVLIFGALMLIVAVGTGAWTRPSLNPHELGERRLFTFRVGAGIYLGSFLLGTNHDYGRSFFFFASPCCSTYSSRASP
jgi:hypothetical protein